MSDKKDFWNGCWIEGCYGRADYVMEEPITKRRVEVCQDCASAMKSFQRPWRLIRTMKSDLQDLQVSVGEFLTALERESGVEAFVNVIAGYLAHRDRSYSPRDALYQALWEYWLGRHYARMNHPSGGQQ